MNIGLVGLGNMGRNHLRVCRKLEDEFEDFNLTTLYDPAHEGMNDLESFMNSVASLDGVIICAPSHLHVDISQKLFSINNSIKLLIEKPIDDDIEKAQTLVEYEDRIFVGHIERFNPAVRKLKEMIELKEITGINTIRTKRLGNFIARSSQYVNLDLLVHDVDVANFLLGAGHIEKRIVKNQTKNDGKTDHAILLAVYDNKQRTTLVSEASWIEPEKIRNLELVCNEGKYYMDYIKQEIKFISYTGDVQNIKVEKKEPLYEELVHFKEFVDNKKPTGCSVNDAIIALHEVM